MMDQEPSEPDAHRLGWLDAVFYDWHNEHLLRRQRRDEMFYARLLADLDRVVVLGAGTGRVSTPIAEHSRGTVVAVDRSIYRLRRAPRRGNVSYVVGDIRALPLRSAVADAAVYPYSTFQLLQSGADRATALREVNRILRPQATLLIDLSLRFEHRPPGRTRRIALTAYCRELDAVVTEVEEAEMLADHLAIRRLFYRGDDLLATVDERLFFASSLGLEDLLSESGFRIVEAIRGYSPDTAHRRIYVVRREKEATLAAGPANRGDVG